MRLFYSRSDNWSGKVTIFCDWKQLFKVSDNGSSHNLLSDVFKWNCLEWNQDFCYIQNKWFCSWATVPPFTPLIGLLKRHAKGLQVRLTRRWWICCSTVRLTQCLFSGARAVWDWCANHKFDIWRSALYGACPCHHCWPVSKGAWKIRESPHLGTGIPNPPLSFSLNSTFLKNKKT